MFAAGSLRTAFEQIARSLWPHDRPPLSLTFGASGLLKDRILAGAAPAVYASANGAHPRALVAAGKAVWARPFAGNDLCVLARPGFCLQGKPLLQRLLDDDVRVGTSTPGADPSGDYALALFGRIESTGAGPAGSAAALERKAMRLTGAPDLPKPARMSDSRSVYGALLAGGLADVFVTYRTNAEAARHECPGLEVLSLPASVNVAAEYWLALLNPSLATARGFADAVLGAPGQAVLARCGFRPAPGDAATPPSP